MFFSLIRPLIRWKIQRLLDDGKQPGAFFSWLLKKDRISRQYYQAMLRLEAELRERIPSNESAQHDLKPAFAKNSAKHDRKRKSYATAASAAILLLVAGALFFPYHFERDELAVVTPPPFGPLPSPSPQPVVSHEAKGGPSDLQLFAENVVPSGVREVFRPALVPIKETYDFGKEQLLEDIGTLPIKPLTDFSRRLYSGNSQADSNGDPEPDTQENRSENLSSWINPDLFNINWLIPGQP